MADITFKPNIFFNYQQDFQQETGKLPDEDWSAYFAFIAAKVAVDNYNLTLELQRQLNSYIEEKHREEGK